MSFYLFGGIGLFLLGMVLLTDGLKAFAGDALRQALVKFTGTPLTAFASGTLVTVLVQSSSATTVAVIGFVSAGLLTFPQALGVVFGASLGTTGTGWIVSVLGLKISLGTYALPLVGIGAFLKLLARGRWRSIGLALAGFGLIFVGIDTLQEGMEGLSGAFDVAAMPSTGLVGHLIAMGIGFLMTLVLQSSSAAVATTLTALHTGAVSFEQAASLVIGAAVGTTVTAALAAIGANVPAKRTALAFVLFNLATGVIALVMLPLFLWVIGWAQGSMGLSPGAISLAAFHTLFIAVGVGIFLPLVRPFAKMIERLLPERGPVLTRHLDKSLIETPAVALEASLRSLRDTAIDTFDLLGRIISGDAGDGVDSKIAEVRQATAEVQHFLATVPPGRDDVTLGPLRTAQMHTIDHLVRLQSRLHPNEGILRVLQHPRMAEAVGLARHILQSARAGMEHAQEPGEWIPDLRDTAIELAELRRKDRALVLDQTARGASNPAETMEILDAIRWLDRIGYHSWRLAVHLVPEDSDWSDPTGNDSHPDD